MKDDESIINMIIRFTNIANSVKGLDQNFTNDELVNKILRSLPKSQATLKAIIETTKNMAKYTLNALWSIDDS